MVPRPPGPGHRRLRLRAAASVSLGLGALGLSVAALVACADLLGLESPRESRPEAGSCAGERPVRCGGECVDTTRDLHHCGGCDRPCLAQGPGTTFCAPQGGGVCKTCGSEELRCGDDCTAILRDPENCGGCGKSCAGGPCVDGQCQAFTLVTDMNFLASMAVAGDELYFLATLGGVGSVLGHVGRRGPACSAREGRCVVPIPATLFAGDAGLPSPVPTAMAADDTHLYLALYQRGLVRRPRGGGPWEEVWPFPSADSIEGLRVGSDAIYLGTTQSTYATALSKTPSVSVRELGRCTGCGSVPIVAFRHEPGTSNLFLTMAVAFAMRPGIHRLPVEPGAPPCVGDACLFLDVSDTPGFTLGGPWVYAGVRENETTTRIQRRLADGPCPTTGPCWELRVEGVPFEDGYQPLLVTARHLYWIAHEPDGDLALRRLPVDETCLGATAGASCGEVVLAKLRWPVVLEQDDEGVYVGHRLPDLSATIVKVAK